MWLKRIGYIRMDLSQLGGHILKRVTLTTTTVTWRPCAISWKVILSYYNDGFIFPSSLFYYRFYPIFLKHASKIATWSLYEGNTWNKWMMRQQMMKVEIVRLSKKMMKMSKQLMETLIKAKLIKLSKLDETGICQTCEKWKLWDFCSLSFCSSTLI